MSHILFRTDGYTTLGLGHIFRTKILASELMEYGHEIIAITSACHPTGGKLLREAGIKVIEAKDDEEIFSIVDEMCPDVYVNDLLDTDAAYIKRIRKSVASIVSFEDRGSGTAYADAVVNALYEDKCSENETEYNGAGYVCLRRDTIECAQAKNANRECDGDITDDSLAKPRIRFIATFGGSDPLDMSARIYNIIENTLAVRYPDVEWTIVLGPGYTGEISGKAGDFDGNHSDGAPTISVLRNPTNFTSLMASADVAVCSQGNTVYELASLGVPAAVIAQNDREMMHGFASEDTGFMLLGHGNALEDETLTDTIALLVDEDSEQVRKMMRARQLECDVSGGTGRCVDIILGQEQPVER